MSHLTNNALQLVKYFRGEEHGRIGMKIPPHIMDELKTLCTEMDPKPFFKLVELVCGLAREDLLGVQTFAGDSCDGGSVYWPDHKYWCYSIVANEFSDEIRELDGGYITVKIGATGQVEISASFDNLEAALAAMKRDLRRHIY